MNLSVTRVDGRGTCASEALAFVVAVVSSVTVVASIGVVLASNGLHLSKVQLASVGCLAFIFATFGYLAWRRAPRTTITDVLTLACANAFGATVVMGIIAAYVSLV